jgi:hypothetical protein
MHSSIVALIAPQLECPNTTTKEVLNFEIANSMLPICEAGWLQGGRFHQGGRAYDNPIYHCDDVNDEHHFL